MFHSIERDQSNISDCNTGKQGTSEAAQVLDGAKGENRANRPDQKCVTSKAKQYFSSEDPLRAKQVPTALHKVFLHSVELEIYVSYAAKIKVKEVLKPKEMAKS